MFFYLLNHSLHSVCAMTEDLFECVLTCMCRIQCYHHLAYDGFLAGSTDTFSHCLNSKPVEVGLQAAQHVVQFVGRFGRTSGGGLSLGLDLMGTEDKSGFTIAFRRMMSGYK